MVHGVLSCQLNDQRRQDEEREHDRGDAAGHTSYSGGRNDREPVVAVGLSEGSLHGQGVFRYGIDVHDEEVSRRTRNLCAALVAVAAVPTIFVDGILNGTPVMNGSARGTALTMFALALPVLAVGLVASTRGSVRGRAAEIGALAYLTYNATLLVCHPVHRAVPGLRRAARAVAVDPGQCAA
jgi:hypothetical protein